MKKLFFALLAIGLVWQPQVEGMKGSSIPTIKPNLKTIIFSSNHNQEKLSEDAKELLKPQTKKIFNSLLTQIKKTMKTIKDKNLKLIAQTFKTNKTKDDNKLIQETETISKYLRWHYATVTRLIKFEREVLQKFKIIDLELTVYNSSIDFIN